MKHILFTQLFIATVFFLTRDVLLAKTYSTPIDDSLLLPILEKSVSLQKHSPNVASSINDEYDYIVVGGGASGSVIASRLSEEPCVTVLLLEAGPEPPLLTEVPGLSRYVRGTELDWKYKSVPQKYAASALKNRQTSLTAGKMLGGSASLNGMAYVRGNKKDFDKWAEQGAKGWSYKDIFPYFLKLEDNRDPAFLANGYHAVGGPITAEQPDYHPILKQGAYVAAVQMGYQFVDPNAAQQTGFYDLQANIIDNQRCSPVKGYLVPAENRNNLDISLNSSVTRIIFNNGQATAVEFYNGSDQQVKARKEIIITAGTLNTPKILLLSGVGPAEELQKFEIPVVADLPVGRNFHDHCGTDYFFTLDPNIRGIREKLADPASIIQYIASRSGPLASTDNLLIAFLYGMNVTAPIDFPNYEIYISEIDSELVKSLDVTPEVHHQLIAPYENGAIFRCTSQDLRTRSRGVVTLNSSNPFDPPLLDPNYLKDSRDLENIVDGLKFCQKILTTEPMLRLGAKPFQTVMPGCEMFVNDKDEYFRCYVRRYSFAFLHFAGAAKMGDPSDPTTVVDPELRVKGVKGLRVADASVMPQVTTGNTHIPVVMIAEKASDMIKSSISCPRTTDKTKNSSPESHRTRHY